MRSFLALTVFASALMPTVGFADWQYTKWGMSVDEIDRMSNGQFHSPTSQDRSRDRATIRQGMRPSLVGTYQTSAHVFWCELYFPPPAFGLGLVALTAIHYRQDGSILDALRGLYGEPVEVHSLSIGGSTYRWRDDIHNNAVQAYDIEGLHVFIVFYTPLRSRAEKGL